MSDSAGEPDWVKHPDLVEFYSAERSAPEDLYPSEARFIPWLAAGADRVLDVGCGAGGFAAIWEHHHPGIAYVGVDASAALIDAARRLHPAATFEQADGAGDLPFPDGFADVVAGLGWLHLEPRWRQALPELWRVTGRRLFFDMRLQTRSPTDEIGAQRLALAGDWDGTTTIPYIAAPWNEVARELANLRPSRILGYGYSGAPASTVDGMEEPICFATFVLERGAGAATPEVALDLPLTWPDDVPADVRRLDDSEARP